MTKTPVRFADLFRYWRGEPHQLAAVELLGREIPVELLSREQEWFKVWSQAGRTPEPEWLAPALKIIKTWEGCRLVAYQCAAGVWTIGWGATRLIDRPVKQGDKISQQMADDMLQNTVEITARELFKLLPMAAKWPGHQSAALLSWMFNVGSGAVRDSTMRSRLLAGQDPKQVIREELPKWDKANGKPLAGLTRRRAAEVKLFLGAEAAKKLSDHGNPLHVPWYAQLDSSTDQGARMCFSSSCAMLLQYLKPNTLTGPNGDDQYLKRVQHYGDTTEIAAQIRALSSFGIRATMAKTATVQTLRNQIDAGIPVPCGYIHRGPLNRPSGGGHWLIVVGYTTKQLIVHDPYGSMNLNSGERASSVARFAKYDLNDFVLRWSVEPTGPGTYKHVANRGWAIIAER